MAVLPAAAYLDDEVLAWERAHLFAAGWVSAGRSADLEEPGTRRALTVGDDTVLLVRGDDGELRGFFNVCRHRAHELAPCGSTSGQRSIQCPYHGWRYGLDGALLATPRFEAPDGFDRSEHALVPVAVEDWHGWTMVNVTGDAPPVDRFLAGIESHVAGHRPERLVVGADPLVRAGVQLEARRRELPGVPALPEHPPRAVRSQPAGERGQPRRS